MELKRVWWASCFTCWRSCPFAKFDLCSMNQFIFIPRGRRQSPVKLSNSFSFLNYEYWTKKNKLFKRNTLSSGWSVCVRKRLIIIDVRIHVVDGDNETKKRRDKSFTFIEWMNDRTVYQCIYTQLITLCLFRVHFLSRFFLSQQFLLNKNRLSYFASFIINRLS